MNLSAFAVCIPLLLVLTFVLGGCSASLSLKSITVTPAAGVQTLSAKGQTGQFKATGNFGQTTQDITNAVIWSSSDSSVATVSASGVVTAVNSGRAIITASTTGVPTDLTATSDVKVVIGSTTTPPSDTPVLTSISILPDTGRTSTPGETVQFIAVGKFTGSSSTKDLTNLVTWSSSNVRVATINPAGLATTVADGSTTIIAKAVAANGDAIIGTATFTSGATSSDPVTLPTLTVYRVGNNALAGTVTASYTGPAGTTITPINCGLTSPNAQCTGHFPVGAVVTLTTPNQGATPVFGGWSSNCSTPVLPPVGEGVYSCQITMAGPAAGATVNLTVGAIFD